MHDHTTTLIELALSEDIGDRDVTSLYFIPESATARAFITARSQGVISGVSVAAQTFQTVDPSLEVEILVHDGSCVSHGALLIRIEGNARSILTAERTALNFLQRLSGIATLTHSYVQAVEDTRTRILDTRKTTPGYRFLEKQAVRHGGGTNHRIGLYDRAMVKDNHLATERSLESLQSAIHQLKEDHPDVQVELEADTLDQVRSFLQLTGVDFILLDNMSLTELREAVGMRGEKAYPAFEASGGITHSRLRDIAETGVDFISVGALTHSAPALDVGLDFIPNPIETSP